jgi:hypothetical protein
MKSAHLPDSFWIRASPQASVLFGTMIPRILPSIVIRLLVGVSPFHRLFQADYFDAMFLQADSPRQRSCYFACNP